MENQDKRVVLCGANAYEQKYYFNEQFKGIPQSIQDELHIICVLFMKMTFFMTRSVVVC